MSDSTTVLAASATALANTLPPHPGNKAPTSSSLAQVEPFNAAAREAFLLFLESRRDIARERTTTVEKREMMN